MKYFLLISLFVLAACGQKEKTPANPEATINLEAKSGIVTGITNFGIFKDDAPSAKIITFNINNNGTEPLIGPASLDNTDFSLVYQNCSGSIKVKGSCFLKVSFLAKGKSPGVYTANLMLDSVFQSLTATVEASEVLADSQFLLASSVITSLDFGQLSEKQSVIKSFSIKNTGSGPSLDYVEISNEFTLLYDSCSGKTIDKNGICQVKVSLSGKGKSGTVTGQLSYSGKKLDLTGEVVTASSGGSGSITPNVVFLQGKNIVTEPINLGVVSADSSKQLIINIKNIGNLAAAASSAVLSDSNFSIIYNQCLNRSLAQNASCQVRLLFSAANKLPNTYTSNLNFGGKTLVVSAQILEPNIKPSPPFVSILLSPDKNTLNITSTCHTDLFGSYIDLFYQYEGSESFVYPQILIGEYLHDDLGLRSDAICVPNGNGNNGLISISIPVVESMRGKEVFVQSIEKGALEWNDSTNSEFSNMSSVEVPFLPVLGCMDPAALNFNPSANQSDDSCEFPPTDQVMYSQPLASSGAPNIRSILSSRSYAQRILVTNKFSLTRIKVSVQKKGNPLGNLKLSLVADNNGIPPEYPLVPVATSSVSLNSFPPDVRTPVEAQFNQMVPAGTYWLVMEGDQDYNASFQSGITFMGILDSEGSPHSNDTAMTWVGSYWSSYPQTLGYQIYGTEIPPVISFTNWTSSASGVISLLPNGGLTGVSGKVGWSNAAKGEAITGDFKLTYIFSIQGQGSGIGDTMIGISPLGSIDISTGLPALYNTGSFLYYADQGSMGYSYTQTPWVNMFYHNVLQQQDYTFIITRTGSEIKYSFSGPNFSQLGVITNNVAGPVTPVIALYNGINFKLSSSTLEQ